MRLDIIIWGRGRTSNEMQSPALYNSWELYISSILNILSSKLNQYGEYQNCPLLKCPVAGNFEAGSSEYVITQNCPPYTTKVQCLDFPSATSAFVFLPKKSSDRPQKICVNERRKKGDDVKESSKWEEEGESEKFKHDFVQFIPLTKK